MDYVGGAEDLKRGVLRVIPNPSALSERPGAHVAGGAFRAKLGFKFEEKDRRTRHVAPLLTTVPPARMFERC